jgi:predicted site-specific integrase-resolvase
MTTIEPECHDTGRYNLTQTCKLLGLSPNTVLKYTESGDLQCGFRKLKKDKTAEASKIKKFYTGSAIKKFWKAQY